MGVVKMQALISVLASLMKGRNDENSSWPFTGEVTITLLNQLEDENHHTRSYNLTFQLVEQCLHFVEPVDSWLTCTVKSQPSAWDHNRPN